MEHVEKQRFLQRLGAWLMRLRKAKGIGQDKLTEQAGLARGTISRIENGAADPRASTLHKISGALRVPLVKLFQW